MDPARQDQNDIPFLYIVRREIQRYISFPLFDIYDLHIGMPVKWDSIEVVSCEKTEDLVKGSIESGKEYTITYVIDEKGLNDAIGLELVTTYTAQDGKQHVYSVEPFNVVKKEGDLYTFQVKHKLENAGSFKVAYRMFPKNADLPHRQDFCYVRWFI